MLLVTKYTGETIALGNDIFITVLSTTKDEVRIGISTDAQINVYEDAHYVPINKQAVLAKENDTISLDDICFACNDELYS